MTERGDAEMSTLKRALVEIRELKARVAAAAEPIAIVGMGLRFPGGANDPESYWQLLVDGVDAITEVPAERWSLERFYDPDPDVPGHMATRWGGFLPDVDLFDAGFFGISPREAEAMDPQQRILLEVTWEALEHAGIPADRLAGSRTGVFVGVTNTDYFRMLLADAEHIDTFTATGNVASVAAGRISYVLGLEGPSIAIDTACSSSLVAVHLAAQSLRSGESDVALAGGVSLVLAPELTINFSRAHMMAADGRCKTFDASADGYVRSDGCGMIVLKRLSDAQASGDRVLAVIRGSAVNQDGRSGGLTAPNGPAQERVLAAALASARVDAAAVGYVETHGTGTPLGDPIEVHALAGVLGRDRTAADPLLLGSVKTNIGHLEGAAGVAGLIKVALMLQHGIVPPHLHLRELNPYIAEAGLPIEVPTVATAWPRPPSGRVAGVSSFGISGTNAHVVLAEAPVPEAAIVPVAADRPTVLTVSARSDGALRRLASQYADLLRSAAAEPSEARGGLHEIAASALLRRAQLGHRLAVVATDVGEAAAELEAFASARPGSAVTGHAAAEATDVVFLFSGHGSQSAGMGAQLYEREAVFRDAIDRCALLVDGDLARSLTDILFAPGEDLQSMRNAQPALFALQYALAELWRSWGVRPAAVAGHSAGEYVAAVVAGVMTLADALRLVISRGRLLDEVGPGGEMVAVFLPEDEVAAAVAPFAATVGIAAVNGPATTVISGTRASVAAVIEALDLAPDDHRRLDVSVAAHSPLLDPILDRFEATARTIDPSDPQVPLISSLTGSPAPRADAPYWRRHLREPVRFAAVIDNLHRSGYRAFVEIGPGSTLLKLGRRCVPDGGCTWVPSIEAGEDEAHTMLTGLATLHVHGAAVDWPAALGGVSHARVDLPHYPWQRQRHWAPAAQRSAEPTPWPVVTAAAATQAEQGPLDLHVDRYARGWAVLDDLATAAITDALRRRGAFVAAGERHTAAALVESGSISAQYEGLVGRWLAHLADDGVLIRHDDGSFEAAAPLPVHPLQSRIDDATAQLPGAEELVGYVARCAENLADVVSGEESALATLFPDGSYATVDFLYHRWAVARYFNGIVRAAVLAAAHAHPGRALRVLEVGAGTGGTTAGVLAALPPDRTTYTFTDVSEFFLTRAAERFSAHPFVRYALFDLEREITGQDVVPGGYDVVIAANVLHATGDLDRTLQRVHELLAPGGTLIAYEATEHFRWFDVTTGLIEGWQRFADRWRADNPLLDASTWSAALLANGFAEARVLPDDEQPTAILGQRVLLARAAGEWRAPVATDGARQHVPAAGADSGIRPAVAVPDRAEIDASLAEALPNERVEVFVDVVRRAVAHVLRIADPGGVPRDQPLLDLGFDSLMAVELRDVLRRSLRLARRPPATLVFDHPTVAALAAHVEQLLDASGDLDISGRAAAGVTATTGDAGLVPIGADELAELSEDDVTTLLLAKLADVEDAR